MTVIGAPGICAGDIPTGDRFNWSPEQRLCRLVADPELAARILALPQTAEQQETAIRNHLTTAKLAGEPRFVDPNLHKWLHRIRLPTPVIRCGHLPQVERPGVLADLLADLLRATV